MRRTLIGLLCAGTVAMDGPAAARQYVPPSIDVAAALQRFQSAGTHPEENSLEFFDLQRAVLAVPNRDPFGNVSELAGRVFARAAVDLRQPLLAPDGRPVVRAALWTPSPEIDPATRYLALFDASLDGSPWFPLVQASGDVFCDVDLQERFGAASKAPGWHTLSIRATVSAWPGVKRVSLCESARAGGAASTPGGTPFWRETRSLPAVVYGVMSTSAVRGTAGTLGPDPRKPAPPEDWLRSALDATAAAIDSSLPVKPLAGWLRETLARAGRARAGTGPTWEVVYCGNDNVDRFPDRSRAEICARATDRVSRLEVSLEFSLGPFQDDLGLRLAPDPVTFRGGFVATTAESFEMKRLSDLDAALAKPPGEWPAPDLRVSADDIVFQPPAPFPGDLVSVLFTVHNDGPSDERALIEFALSAPGMTAAERGRFFADVPAGGTYQFSRTVRLPMTLGAGHAAIETRVAPPRRSMRPVRERKTDNNTAVKLLGAWRRRC